MDSYTAVFRDRHGGEWTHTETWPHDPTFAAAMLLYSIHGVLSGGGTLVRIELPDREAVSA